jgi:hypothetical protein
VERFRAAEGLEITREFTEVETGKGADALNRRPQLAAALAGATARVRWDAYLAPAASRLAVAAGVTGTTSRTDAREGPSPRPKFSERPRRASSHGLPNRDFWEGRLACSQADDMAKPLIMLNGTRGAGGTSSARTSGGSSSGLCRPASSRSPPVRSRPGSPARLARPNLAKIRSGSGRYSSAPSAPSLAFWFSPVSAARLASGNPNRGGARRNRPIGAPDRVLRLFPEDCRSRDRPWANC